MNAQLIKHLKRVDWDFVSNNPTESAGLHWYPGNFVPEIPGAIIDLLSERGDWVFDPFGGIGTTALAAIVRGRSAVSCDSNPVASLTAYATCGAVLLRKRAPDLFDDLFDEISEMATVACGGGSLLLSSARRTRDIDRTVTKTMGADPGEFLQSICVGAPVSAALKKWYEPTTLDGILAFKEVIDQQHKSAFVQLFSILMMSSTCRSLSSQTKSWGHVADRVLPLEMIAKRPAKAFQGWLARARKRLAQIGDTAVLSKRPPLVSIRMADWGAAPRRLLSRKVKLMITSPPYAGAIDYTLAQRLSLYLFGYDEDHVTDLARIEIGARRKRFDKSHIDTWASQLCTATESFLPYMSSTSNMVFILPHKDAGREAGETRLRELLESQGWACLLQRDRSIRQVKARQSWTSIKQETILIFGRSDGG